MDEQFLIRDLDTLKALADPTRLTIIEALLEPRTVTQLADRLELPRTRLYHHINLLVERGLIRVVETHQVGAIPERVYQATAKSFRPDRTLLAGAENIDAAEAVLTAIFDATRADVARVLRSGVTDLDPTRGRRRMGLERRLLLLDPERAAELFGRIEALLEEYDTDGDPSQAGKGVESYAFTWAFYPSPKQLL